MNFEQKESFNNKTNTMSIKKISLPLMAAFVAFLMVSCNNEKNEDEKNEATETERMEAKNDSASTTPVSPAGEIALDKLPPGVNEYVKKNYAGYTINKAASDPLCQGGDAIDVAVSKAGAPNLSLIFKPDGSFVQQEEDVPMKSAPEKVKDALASKFADYKAGDQIEKILLADKTVQYLVDLSKGSATKEVIFSVTGAVVCEK